MEASLLAQAAFLRNVFDAIPAVLVIVDSDVQILHLNSAAATTLGLDIRKIYDQKGGDALGCIHSTSTPGGCGKSPSCEECVIRNSVKEAILGNKVHRKAARMEMDRGGIRTELHLLVSTAPFQFEEKNYVLLTIEDVSELIQLRSILPICMHCGKIRNDEGYWKDVTEYFTTHLDVKFSHGVCNVCLTRHYPDE